MPLTPREAFKVGFLSRCVEEGLDADQIRERVKSALDKLAFEIPGADVPGKLVDFAKGVGLTGLSWGLPLALAGPPIVGGLGGYALAKATDVGDADAGEIKKRELVDEYRRQTDQLNRETQVRNYRKLRERTGKIFL